ncbi:MAG: transporter substrate-binding domain-containing protein, partial [Spirochaetales bacterium]|nr:transporter substrate-binding domain-containing protein [Spirochaetales bacterium]
MKKIAILLLCLLFIIVNVHSDEIPMATGEWTPYTSESMEHYGFFTQIVTEVFKEMGVEYKYVFYPWRRCYDSVLNSSVWAAFPYSYTEERAQDVMFSDAIAYSSTKLFYYKNDNY